MDILDPRDASAGDDGQALRLGQRQSRLDVAALEQAVAADIGVQQRGDARILEPARKVLHRQIGDARPALGCDHPVARVDRNHHAAGMIRRQRLDQFGVLQRSRADHHPRHAELQPALRTLARADATAELHLAREAFEDALNRVGIDLLAREGSVEVDHVQPARPCLRKARGLFARIIHAIIDFIWPF